ncbi:MAG TPA: tetratricopeptide repeat protein [Saprospiraceae bacterium]|nr:tetratricopeptide repeat protein [Saprospiraceae bacterium]HMP22541.1 tetratricopeptide repeat protein [Saprospiraceae bacterium]
MKNLIPHFIQEQYEQGKLRGQLQAYTMFIDLSGFTPLTETLMGRGNRGAEELSNILNEIFAPLVRIVYARGGFIPYFAGDAFTAVFPARQSSTTPAEFVQTALQVRHFFGSRASRFGDFTIGLKIGLSWGRVDWGIVGKEYKSYYFRGAPIDNSAQCQTQAANQEIVLDEAFYQVLPQTLFRAEAIAPHFYRLAGHQQVEQGRSKAAITPFIKPDIVKRFLPESVLNFSGEGEFRAAITIFIAFDGLDSHEQLDLFTTLVLEKINTFSGYFKEIDFGDKGSVISCFFGAPVSFENAIDRALEFICALREELQPLQEQIPVRFRAGMTIGTAYAGMVGGEERCQYAVVGNRVNLAARLMTFADWGEILVDNEFNKNRHFTFAPKGDIRYKGIKGTVPTYILTGRNQEHRTTFDGQMVGRDTEIQQLFDFAAALHHKEPAGIAYIYGEAGIGKSRLTHEFRDALCAAEGVAWFVCQADQILRKPFNPFIYFLRSYFEQPPDGSMNGAREHFESRLQGLIQRLASVNNFPEVEFVRKELLRTRSVLAAQLGIVYPDSIWEQLDAKGRYQNTIQAMINLIIAESLIQPIVLQLEDAHWLDDNSREVLQELPRHLGRYPILLLVTSRLLDDGTRPHLFDTDSLLTLDIRQLELNLNTLAPEAVRHFAEASLQGPVSEDFFELLLRATNSNPFYVEQILEYFSESGVLIYTDGIWTIKDKNIRLSGSINAILTARIDRLSVLVKETVKAAAVIGREFEIPVLSEVMKEQEAFSKHNGNGTQLLREQVKTAEHGQIWHAMNELRYIFRHSLLREAAYGMQLRTRLQQLHKLIAEAIEKIYADRIEERYFDLAFHYEQASVFDKTCEYLRKAADYARRNYQNQLALEYYEKLLRQLGKEEDVERQVRTYLQKGKVLELIGHWEECEQTYNKALKLAKQTRDALLLGQCNNNLGRLLVLKGDYQNAAAQLQTALQLFESIENHTGIAKVYGNIGNLYFRQGNYEKAKSFFSQSIDISQGATEMPNSQIVASLGLTYMNQGNYDDAIRCQQIQLNLAQHHNDKQGVADLYTKIGIVYFEKGDYDAALESFEKGLEVSRELGNKQLTSIALGGIGSVYERKGDYARAMQLFEQDLALCEEIGDKQGIAIALGLIGELLSFKGEFYKAIDYLQKDLMICEALGYQKGLAKAVNTLADVFFYLQQYDRSLAYYNRAIDITRKIGNKLVLGFSLTEKGTVLIETGTLHELGQVVEDALAIARELGNPDLLFEAEILAAKHHRLQNNPAEAETLLQNLLQRPLQLAQQAAVYAELFKIHPQRAELRQDALRLYYELYTATPRYSFKMQIDALEEQI